MVELLAGRSYDNVYLWLMTFRDDGISCLWACFDMAIAKMALAEGQ
jgi:ketosteroid isomerase-like protein